jgi:hypothetical protein
MALLVITINDPSLDKKSAEVAYAKRAVDEAIKEFGRGSALSTLRIRRMSSWQPSPKLAVGPKMISRAFCKWNRATNSRAASV